MEDRYHRYQGYRRVSSTFRIFLPWFGSMRLGELSKGVWFRFFLGVCAILFCFSSILNFIEFYPRNYLSSFAYEYIRVFNKEF